VNRTYEEAFAEVDEILKLMPIDLLSKIPMQFRQLISENKANDYKIEIQEPLEKENFKEETIAILGLIYRDFLASPDEREELQLRDAEELKKIEEKIQKQYDVENIFEKRKSVAKTELTVYKEPGVIKKLFNLIKGIFKKNKF